MYNSDPSPNLSELAVYNSDPSPNLSELAVYNSDPNHSEFAVSLVDGLKGRVGMLLRSTFLSYLPKLLLATNISKGLTVI